MTSHLEACGRKMSHGPGHCQRESGHPDGCWWDRDGKPYPFGADATLAEFIVLAQREHGQERQRPQRR